MQLVASRHSGVVWSWRHRVAVLLGCAMANAVAAQDVTLIHASAAAPAGEDLVGSWTRAADGAAITFTLGEDLLRVLPGTYRRDGAQLHLRPSDDAGGRALSLVGLRTLCQEEVPERMALVSGFICTDHLALPIAAWRLADGLDWPWVDLSGGFDGIHRRCRRLNPKAEGFSFASASGAYVDKDAKPIAIGAGGAQPGDLIAVAPPNERREAVWGLVCVLVGDAGIIGVLDPADPVVCCQDPEGRLLPQAFATELGHAAGGPAAVFIYQRDPETLKPPPRSTSIRDLHNPIWQLPRWRQMLALAGMVLLIGVMVRYGRRMRRKASP